MSILFYYTGIAISGQFEHSSPVCACLCVSPRRQVHRTGRPVCLRSEFLKVGFRLRSSNYVETSQSDNQHRLCNLSRRRYRRRIIRAGRALHAGMPGTEGNRLILQQRVTLWKNIKLDLFRLSVFGSLWVGGFEVFMDTPVVEDLH